MTIVTEERGDLTGARGDLTGGRGDLTGNSTGARVGVFLPSWTGRC